MLLFFIYSLSPFIMCFKIFDASISGSIPHFYKMLPRSPYNEINVEIKYINYYLDYNTQ